MRGSSEMGEVAGIRRRGRIRGGGRESYTHGGKQTRSIAVLCTLYVLGIRGGMDICMNGKGTMQHD